MPGNHVPPHVIAITNATMAVAAALGSLAALVDRDLFTGGVGGYSCYRLPNLLQLRAPGSLVAIAKGQ